MKSTLVRRSRFFARPEKAFPQISPDARHIAYLAYQGNQVQIRLFQNNADANDKQQTVFVSENPGITFFWTHSSEHLLVIEQSMAERKSCLHVVDCRSGQHRQLCAELGGALHLLNQSANVPEQVLIGTNSRDARWYDIYCLDYLQDTMELVFENNRFSGFLASDLQLRLAVSETETGANEYYAPDATGEWLPVFTVAAEDAQTTEPICVYPAQNRVYLRDSRRHDTGALTVMDLSTGACDTLLQDAQADLDEVLLNTSQTGVDAVSFNYIRKGWHAVDAAYAEDLEFLQQANSGDLAISNRDAADRYWVVGYANDDQPNKYYCYDRQAKQLSFLFANIADFESLALRKMQHIVTRSADDRFDLVSYYTMPSESDQQQAVPLVVLVHGGPWARDQWGYNPWHQWLANRGYAVISVNFRGSSGFGKAFMNAGNREWGASMIDDIHTVIGAVTEKEHIDSQRIGVMGTSYGGYAALMLASRYSDDVCCAIDIFGPTDLNKMIQSIPPQWQSQRDMLKFRVGDPDTAAGKESLAAQSPINMVEQVNGPVLVVEGFHDPRVDRNSIRDYVAAFQKNNSNPIMHLSFPDEGHNLSRDKNRFTFCAIAERFLQTYLGGNSEDFDEALLEHVEILSGKELIVENWL